MIRGTCRDCFEPFVVVYTIDGHPFWIYPDPVEDGELVLKGDPLNIPAGHFVAALYGVGPEGDEFFGIPADAPRYRRHRH